MAITVDADKLREAGWWSTGWRIAKIFKDLGFTVFDEEGFSPHIPPIAFRILKHALEITGKSYAQGYLAETIKLLCAEIPTEQRRVKLRLKFDR